MRRLVRPLILCLACLSGVGCQAVSPPGKGVADAGADAGDQPDAGMDGSGACAADGESCADGASCCGDLVCLSLDDGPLQCHAACSEHADCSSGCCVDVRMSGAPSQKLCGEAAICFPDGCEPEGEGCGADAPCCAGLVCVAGATPDTRDGCHPRCGSGDDCESGCCVLFANSDNGFCDEASYCMCIELGDSCPDEGRSCCEGSRCARFGSDPFSCLGTCESDEDCGGNCCSEVSNGASVCAPFPC